MVRDLKAQEGVDGLQGFAVIAGYQDFAAVRRFAVGVANLFAKLGHGSGSRGRSVMDEHGHIEVTCSEAPADVR